MIKRILTMCTALTAVLAAGSAGSSPAQAQQGYQVPPGSVYSPAPPPYPPADYRRAPAMPDFDALDDDDAPNGPGSTALSPPSPPVYSDRGAPRGPILSPDDPRYALPDGPPPVIYSNRPGQPQPAYSDNGGDNRIPGSGIVYPNDDNRGPRPPGAHWRYRNRAAPPGRRRQADGAVRAAAG